MEISMLELALLVWAFVATSLWLDARSDARAAKMMLKAIIENDDFRNGIVSKFKKLREQNATQ